MSPHLGNGEQGLVDLSFRDFSVHYDKSHRYETQIQVIMSIHSLLRKCRYTWVAETRGW